MQNKLCSKCNQLLPATAFHVRRASHDGLAPNCAACKNNQHRIDYWGMPEQGAKQRARSIVNRQARFAADPAYKRAFHLWGTTKKRTVIPPWVSIVDFVPVCRAVLLAGDGYELDHVIPLKGKLVSGLHVPSNVVVVLKEANQVKSNHFSIDQQSNV